MRRIDPDLDADLQRLIDRAAAQIAVPSRLGRHARRLTLLPLLGTAAVVVVVVVASLLIGHALTDERRAVATQPTTATRVPCGTPAPAVADPVEVTGAGPRLGPLLIPGFGSATPPAPAPIGVPTKVLIHPVEPFDQPITLTGARCSDGQPLRFWYRDGTPFGLLGPGSTPIPEAMLAQTGDLSVELRPNEGTALNAQNGRDYVGYMLFTTTGAWRLHAKSGDRDLGEIVVLVLR